MCIFNYFKQLVYMRFVFSDIVYAGPLCSANLHKFFFSFVHSFVRLLVFVCWCSLVLVFLLFIAAVCFHFHLHLASVKNKKPNLTLNPNKEQKIKTDSKYTPWLARYDRSTFLFEFEINSCACHVIDRNMFFCLFPVFSHVGNRNFTMCAEYSTGLCRLFVMRVGFFFCFFS